MRSGCWPSCSVICATGFIVRGRSGGLRFPSPGVVCGRSAFPRSRHTPRSSRQSLGSLVVTHPFHPLVGERLRVLFVRRWAGSRLYVCEGPLGNVSLPEDATDRGPEPASGPLTVEVLAELFCVAGAIGGSVVAEEDC